MQFIGVTYSIYRGYVHSLPRVTTLPNHQVTALETNSLAAPVEADPPKLNSICAYPYEEKTTCWSGGSIIGNIINVWEKHMLNCESAFFKFVC